MSLKAKIEAVIYASEEPVTLAQLTGLLGEEAQAELDALADRQQTLALEDRPTGDDRGGVEADTDAVNADALNLEVLNAEVLDAEALNAEVLNAAEDAGPVYDEKAVAAGLREANRIKDRRLRDHFRSLLDQLIADYASEARGLEIREVAGGFRLATKPEYHDAVRGFVKSLKPPLKLSLQALETLAVVAYKQPVTSPEVSEIRGVDSAGVLGSLMARKLVNTAGRKQVIGRPILYKTTKDFLLRFGLKDINELPSIEEFEKMAGELNAAIGDPVQEEIPMETLPSESSQGRQQDREGESRAARSERGTPAPSLDELHSAPRSSHVYHETTDDLMSEKSTALQSRNREPMDTHPVQPRSQPESRSERESQLEDESQLEAESQSESQLRAEDGDDQPENIADEAVIDGRLSGPPPSYADDNPSAEEAREQQDQVGEE